MRLSSKDQRVFSRISGDYNPIHLDARWAERVFPGRIVVYGILLALRALEEINFRAPFFGLDVKFIKPIFLSEEVSLSCEEGHGKTEVKVLIDGDVAIKIQILHDQSARRQDIKLDDTLLPAAVSECNELTFEQIKDASGCVKLNESENFIESLFPNCCRQIGINTVKGMLALSQIVGMRCPGRRGMFSGFKLWICNKEMGNPHLSYKCVYANKSLGYSRLQVLGYGIGGIIEAYFTLPKDKLVKVSPQSPLQYADSNALIVGGSGLGHTCALLVASGGGKVCVTSRSRPPKGSPVFNLLNDYKNVSNQVLDVTSPASVSSFTNNIDKVVKSIYYFPTPRIFRRRLRTLSEKDTFDFLDFYVFSFVRLIESLYVSNKCSKDVSIFYPSSIAIEEANPDQFEYYISKLAGEEACSLLKKKYPLINTIVVRLPRLETDQTNSFIQIGSSSNLDCLAEIVKQVEASSHCT